MQEKTKCIEYDYKDDGRGIILLLLTEAAHMVHGIQGRSECRISGRPPEDSARHQSQICLGGDPTRDTHQVYYFISKIGLGSHVSGGGVSGTGGDPEKPLD